MILIVDDELENRNALKEVIERDYPGLCLEASCGSDALKMLRSNPQVKLLITDLRMPEMDGLELMQTARWIRPDVQRLMITAYGTIEDTVKAMRAGAFDVLTKPVKLKSLREAIDRLLARSPQTKELETMESEASFNVGGGALLSPAFASVMNTLRKAASSQASVLFLGESGTGKSYLAKILHGWSSRAAGPFVALNSASIPSELLESELFGFEKGAFTGATQSRDGKIKSADKGTLLLDEIADLGTNLQAKLLQFIQDKKYFKLGSNKEIQADVRILSATNQSLDLLSKAGKFREDLLYRLSVVEITVPALRDRKEDLLWLVPALLDTLCEKNNMARVRLTLDAFQMLWNYSWPGNIRELENSLESALVMASPEKLREGFLSTEELPQKLRLSQELENPSQSLLDRAQFAGFPDLATLEKQAIKQALVLTGGNRKQTANLLGVSERTLYRLLSAE